MPQMHKTETFQKLATLLSSDAPKKWCYLQSIYLFHDGAMRLKECYKEDPGSDWKSFNTGSSGFDIMDWWEAYHGMVKEAEGNEFKVARAIIDSNGDLKMNLSYDICDPFADIDLLTLIEQLWPDS